ncbi:branched-chain amino acid ABC transporter permease [Actinophytocola xinjiangensis]|uniref:Branched-chain amino acid ABC transporter permease n=1 Tax=Actinophytocola xinjiangensis TaxID=485602 RepID=A0A7Z1B0Q7_9PSEU|nr:branched-chain amino acid ABC transporter permease [Actinophytocola xinjiangensis]OLF12337.1 branched-chain amino acid ABC transporter permease [Actinophytocola xinjiangensis]
MDILLTSLQQIMSPVTAAYALAAIGLNLHFGFTGLLNFGHAGFLAIGAYGFAISVAVLDLPVVVALLVAVALAVLFALLIGIPTLRLRADYLAIVTIAASEIIRFTVNSSVLAGLTGGAQGINNNEAMGNSYSQAFKDANPFDAGRVEIGPWVFTATQLWAAILTWVVVAVVAALVWALMRSPWGLVLKGIREDEHALTSLGKNVRLYKTQSLIIGGVIGALAGIMLVLPSTVAPGDFNSRLTFNLFTVLLLGGAATILGPVLGAIVFWVLLQASDGLIQLGERGGWLGGFADASQLRFTLVGIVLVVLIVFRPQGMLGDRKELAFDDK